MAPYNPLLPKSLPDLPRPIHFHKMTLREPSLFAVFGPLFSTPVNNFEPDRISDLSSL